MRYFSPDEWKAFFDHIEEDKKRDIAPSFYPRLSSLWRFVWPILAVAGVSWAGAELRIERSA